MSRHPVQIPPTTNQRLFPDQCLLLRLIRADDWHDLEVHEIRPVRYPLVKQHGIIAFHDLVTARQVVGDPAADISETRGHVSPRLFEPAINRRGLTRAEILDDHVAHAGYSTIGVEAGRG